MTAAGTSLWATDRRQTWLYAAAVSSIAAVSLWLRAGFALEGVWGSHDDALFIRSAQHLLHGDWLGPFDPLTLAKGAFFPIFLAANHVAGLPLKMTEHGLYLLVAWLAATTAGNSRGTRLALFAVLALSPVPWGAANSRVVREPLYQILGLALFCLVIRHYARQRPSWALGGILGAVAAAYWLTREEGVWLLPAFAVLTLPVILSLRRQVRSAGGIGVASQAALAIWPVAVFLALVTAMNALNWHYYGVFRNNDFRGSPYVEAYGALARIKHDHWQRYVVFPANARQHAYSVSAAARELQPSFEGDMGKGWASANRHYPKPWGCGDAPEACNQEILSAWFLWALRDATSRAGHYRTAADADSYYRRLAEDINAACDRREIPCHGRRATMAPVWRGHYGRDALIASAAVLATLSDLGHAWIGAPKSDLTPEQATIVRAMTNSTLSHIDEVPPLSRSATDFLRLLVAQTIATGYATTLPWLFTMAVFAYLLMLVAWVLRGESRVSGERVLLLTALFVAVVSRVGMLGFLEATSIPSNNMLYLLPAVPLYLMFTCLGMIAGVQTLVGAMRGRRPA